MNGHNASTFTDFSGTCATAATSQPLFPAISTGDAYERFIWNLSDTDILWISYFGAATADTPGSIPILPQTGLSWTALNAVTVSGSEDQPFTAGERD